MNKIPFFLLLLLSLSGLKASVVELTDSTYQTHIASEGKSVIIFSATWCRVCKKMKPIYKDVANRLSSTILFGEIDVDKNPQSSREFNIKYLPTIILFEQGKELKRANYLPKNALVAFVEGSEVSMGADNEAPSKWIFILSLIICLFIIKTMIDKIGNK